MILEELHMGMSYIVVRRAYYVNESSDHCIKLSENVNWGQGKNTSFIRIF